MSDEPEQVRRFIAEAARAAENIAEFDPQNVDRLQRLNRKDDARDYLVRHTVISWILIWTPCGRKADTVVRIDGEDHPRCERHGGADG